MSRVQGVIKEVQSADAPAKRGRGRPKKEVPQSLPETVDLMTKKLGIDMETKKAEIVDDAIMAGFNEKFGLPDGKGKKAPKKTAPVDDGGPPRLAPPKPAPAKPGAKNDPVQAKKESEWRKRVCLRKGIKIALLEWPHLAELGFRMPSVDAPLHVYSRVMEEIKMEISTVNEPQVIRDGLCSAAKTLESYEHVIGIPLSHPVSLHDVIRETVEVDPDGRSAVAEIALDWAGCFDGQPVMRLGIALARSIKKVAEKNMVAAALHDDRGDRERFKAQAAAAAQQ